MFLSLPTGAWFAIAAAATAVNLVAMRWIIQIPRYRKLQWLMPVIGAVCVGGRGLVQSDGLGMMLFLYTALMLGMPFMLGPVRGQITRDYHRWVEDPSTKAGKAALAWVVTAMAILLIVVAVGVAAGAPSGT